MKSTQAAAPRGANAATPLDRADPSSDSKVPGQSQGDLTNTQPARIVSRSVLPLQPATPAPIVHSVRTRSPRARKALDEGLRRGVAALRLTEQSRREHALNTVADLEAKASKAVQSGAKNADSLVDEAIQAMFEHSQTFRNDEFSTAVEVATNEVHWLEKCLSLYSLKNDLIGCGWSNLTMRTVAGRASERYHSLALNGRRDGLGVNGELYLRSMLCNSYDGDFMPRLQHGRDFEDSLFRDRWLTGASFATAAKVLANPQTLEGIPYKFRAGCKKQLTEFLAKMDEQVIAVVVRHGMPGAGHSPVVPHGLRPVLDAENRATYDAAGNLQERAVPTPQVTLDLTADYLEPPVKNPAR